MKLTKKFLALTLVLATLVGFTLKTETAYAYVDESIISSISNPSYGKITFTVNAPAYGETRYYVHKGTLDNYNIPLISGTFNNTSYSYARSKTITVSVNYTGLYTIEAEPFVSGKSLYTSDDETIINKFSGTMWSDRFTWTQQNVNDYVNGLRISKAFMFTTSMVIDAAFTKGIATACNIGLTIYDLYNTDVTDLSTIQTTPIAGYSYQLKKVADTYGYTTYLYVYNANNVFQNTFNLGYRTWDL